MAITVGRSPIVMDAQGDNLATVFQGRDSEAPTVKSPRLLLTEIKYIAGSQGVCILTDGPAGPPVFISKDCQAGDVDGTAYGDAFWSSNIYAFQLPAGGKVLLSYV